MKYPFSVRKHAHDIEYYRNHIKNTMYAMENGEIPMDANRYDRLEIMYTGPSQELMDAIQFGGNGTICYLTGAQIALAKKIIFWASENRTNHLIAAGKTQYLQYC